MFVCEISKQNQTKLNQTKPNSTKANQKPFNLSEQTKSNQTFSTINLKLTVSNKFKSKLPEMLARAAQLLHRPVLVNLISIVAGPGSAQRSQFGLC